jgi:quercetin dioxygenase-like cupin family protein
MKLLNLLLTDVLKELPDLLAKPEAWGSGDVTESTRLERLSTPWREGQIFLQRFLPTTVHPWHGHPWPSAHLVLSGEVEMGTTDLVVYMTTGSRYEMSRDGEHSMKCVGDECLSIMLTGTIEPGEFEDLVPALSQERKDKLLESFRFFFPRDETS